MVFAKLEGQSQCACPPQHTDQRSQLIMLPLVASAVTRGNFLCLSEGVPHEVFGPWVWWEGGQVIPDLSRRRAQNRSKFPKSGILRFLTHSRVHGLKLPSNWSHGRPAFVVILNFKKWHWDTWTKNDLNMCCFWGPVFCFQQFVCSQTNVRKTCSNKRNTFFFLGIIKLFKLLGTRLEIWTSF